MPNYIDSTLVVTGPNPAAVIAATTTKFTETEYGWEFNKTGPDTSYYTDYAVSKLDPTFDPELQVKVFPDEQTLTATENEVVVSFESAWAGPWAGVARLSKLFPDNTFRLGSWGEFSPYVRAQLYTYKAGVETRLDPREEWSVERKALFAKYNVITTADMGHGDAETSGTIVIDGVTRNWTFDPDGTDKGVTVSDIILDGDQAHEVYRAIVNVLWTFPFNQSKTVVERPDEVDTDPLNQVK